MLQAALDWGAAAEKFAQMVAALGGPKRFVENPWTDMEQAPLQVAVTPGACRYRHPYRYPRRRNGRGRVGGGRTRPQDPVDHAVGLTGLAGLGDAVGPDRPLAIVHARTHAQVAQATELVRSAYRLGGKTGAANEPVLDRITA